MPILFGPLHIAPIVHDFVTAYPQVSARLVLSDPVIDMVEAHVDVAVRIARLPDSDLIARSAGHIRWMFCAGPCCLAAAGEPTTPECLADHDCIAFAVLQTYRSWTIGGGTAARAVPITAEAVVEGAAAGLGIARVLSYQAADAVARGRVRPVLRGCGAVPIRFRST